MDPIKFYDSEFSSRLLLGTSRYPSPQTMLESIEASGAEIITVSLRRESATVKSGQRFFELLRSKNVRILPNTAGCYSAREAIVTAEMARELFDTPWIKLEVIGDDYTLQPDPFGLVEAAKELIAQGFQVFPYMTDDLIIAEKLVNLGCRALMPWGSPIGSGRGLCNQHALAVLRKRFPDITMLVDAGIGRPSDATQALELGYDGVLLNTAVATAENPALMAHAFKYAVEAGRAAFRAGVMEKRDHAVASTPVSGKAVLI